MSVNTDEIDFIDLLNTPNNLHFIKENKSYYEFVLAEIQKAIQNL